MKGRRVFVRGVGAVTPLAPSWPATSAALAGGACAIRPVAGFDVEGFPSRVAAAVRDLPASDEDRRLALALPAAREAWAAAGLAAAPERIGVFLGAESGRARFETLVDLCRAAGGGRTFDHARFGEGARPFAGKLDAAVISPAAVAVALAREVGAAGPCETVCLACASSTAAVVDAVRALRDGSCDVALCGGVGADVDPIMLAGFGVLGALSGRGVSCPFDVRRDGFVVGEGAAMLVLAVERGGATVELAGAGRSLDGHHLTAPDPDGDGAARAMRAALDDAGGGEPGYVQAHGTSTPLNDAVEAAAIRRVLGRGLDRARVASVKGALGHWIAGAGALGILCAFEAVAHGTLLPTANLEQPDPACGPLPHLAGRAVRADVELSLANAFAFGGANASVVLRRCA